MRADKSIYMDYQATTPTDRRVIEAMRPYWEECFGNPHSADHSCGWRAASAIESSLHKVSSLINADPQEVFFTSGATESNNHAIQGVVRANKTHRSRLLIGATEHKCVLASAYALAKAHNLKVDLVPVDEQGFIDESAYSALVSNDVLLVSIMAVNNEIGTIQDIKRLASIAHKHGAMFHCDAAQALLAMDLDVLDMDVDLLSMSAHKIYGPKGIGALYIRPDIQECVEPLIYGGGQQDNVRPGTLPTPLCVGFGEASDILLGSNQERDYVLSLTNRLKEGLLAMGAILNGPEQRHPGNLNVQFPGIEAHLLVSQLQPRVCISTGSACSSGMISESHVLNAIGLNDEAAASSVRFGVGRFSDYEQVDEVLNLVKEALQARES